MSLPPLVVMGVSGSGKSTVAKTLAARIGDAQYLDADDFHTDANKAKMHAGIPLNDVDRAPWLDAVGRAMRDVTGTGRTPVMACSALKQEYRRRILAVEPSAFFVFLDVPRDELNRRLHARTGHFMPSSLLDSQLATLEPLTDGEPGVTIGDTEQSNDVIERIVAQVTAAR